VLIHAPSKVHPITAGQKTAACSIQIGAIQTGLPSPPYRPGEGIPHPGQDHDQWYINEIGKDVVYSAYLGLLSISGMALRKTR
jgi:hypothetical protein